MKVQVEYPSVPEEITIGQYQAYLNFLGDDAEKELTVNDLFKLFVSISPKNLPLNKVSEITDKVTASLRALENYKGFSPSFEHNGVKYGFIPNLDNITFGEYEDLVSTLNDPQQFHKAMEILYRPIESETKDLYRIESYIGYDKTDFDFKRLSVTHFLGAMVFFYLLTDALEIHIKSSITKVVKENAQKNLEELALG